jgi:YVTN family beta-propeller protein
MPAEGTAWLGGFAAGGRSLRPARSLAVRRFLVTVTSMSQRHSHSEARGARVVPVTRSCANVSADGKTLWLSGRFDDEVYAIDTATGQVERIPVGREPHGLTSGRSQALLARPHWQQSFWAKLDTSRAIPLRRARDHLLL